MAAFLAHSRGTVVRVESENASFLGIPFSVRFPDLASSTGIIPGGSVLTPGGFEWRILVTQVSRIEACSLQLQHTFGNTVYAYIFGDRIGELKLSGVCYATSCTVSGSLISGIDTLLSTYVSNKVSHRTSPIAITYGGAKGLLGLLTGMTMEMTDPETQLMQWNFRFNTFEART